MRDQPTPEVTQADVERIVRSDFPPEQFAEVMAVLDEYGVESWQREKPRVQLAVLKLAAGSPKTLRMSIDAAACDYRDVLAAAEFPGYSKKCTGRDKVSPEEEKRVIEGDWKQYETWLKRET